MNEEHRNALLASLPDICRDLDAGAILPYLISKNIIQDGEDEELMAVKRRTTRNRQVIGTLIAGGSSAFREFIVALRSTNKVLLADSILIHLSPSSLQELALLQTDIRARKSLKKMYKERFRTTNPLFLPFTFDVEKTYVSLALRDNSNHWQSTEHHAYLLNSAFKTAKMLIIEGKPASGKTSLMRRLAYEWANGKQELSLYDLVIYAEFREVRERRFESITDLALQFNKNYGNFMDNKVLRELEYLLYKNYCDEKRVLLLLDGYDESSLEEQCAELTTYFSSNTLKNPLNFDVVLTTRPGYFLSGHRLQRGRFAFADVIDFRTKKQKEKFIYNHFQSDSDNRNIIAVRRLLDNNKNMDKLAEKPLFLTFICLVHEHIIEGTLLELYSNIIWWLIDRHQKDFPDRDIPELFGYESNSNDKFETIREHYLEFPQLLYLGEMAFNNLKRDGIQQSDCDQFSIKPIIEQVGLLRKEQKHESLRFKTTFFFLHRTIQECLAALYFFISQENTGRWFPIKSEINTHEMKELEKFVLRIVLSKHILLNTIKQKSYFEIIRDLTLDLTSDAFYTTAGLNSALLNWFISKCTNVYRLQFNGAYKTQISVQSHFTVTNLINLRSLSICICIFKLNSQISITNCPSLKNLEFNRCEIQSRASIYLSKVPTLDASAFYDCTIDLKAWQSIVDEISRNCVKELKLSSEFFLKEENSEFFVHLKKCECMEKMEIAVVPVIFNIEQLTTNLSNIAREMKGLKRISFNDLGKRMKENNRQIIEKAGQERNPDFKIDVIS